MKNEKKIHLRARAVIYKQGMLLLAHDYKMQWNYLPGGHIELGESAESALIREIQEEIDVACSIKRFLGCFEFSWKEKSGALDQEINFVFLVDSEELSIEHAPESKEPKMRFFWCPLDELKDNHFVPPRLITAIPEWLSQSNQNAWISEMAL
jgi:ADP-ribose pyrophosphatase YjhB (NUDIX family)